MEPVGEVALDIRRLQRPILNEPSSIHGLHPTSTGVRVATTCHIEGRGEGGEIESVMLMGVEAVRVEGGPQCGTVGVVGRPIDVPVDDATSIALRSEDRGDEVA